MTSEGELSVDKRPAATDAELDLEAKRIKVERDRTELEQGQANLKLRKRIANGAVVLMALQIWVANGIFVLYGFQNDWNLEAAVINGWLAATVIQVISVVLVITRYLFPNRDTRPSS